MPGLGFPEMLFIFVAALLLFGPRRLPELGRTLGKGLAEFRRASSELKRSLDAEGLEEDLRTTRETIRSVDPRRYIKEALDADEKAGRVARGRIDTATASEQPAAVASRSTDDDIGGDKPGEDAVAERTAEADTVTDDTAADEAPARAAPGGASDRTP